MRFAIGSDHAGFDLKECIKEHLLQRGLAVEDHGAYSRESVDYPDVAGSVARDIRDARADRGILMCGTGVGISIAANKIYGVRAALAWNPAVARLSRQHNDANVLCLAGRFVQEEAALQIVDAWVESHFEGGRHSRRVQKIGDLEATGRHLVSSRGKRSQ